MTIHDLFALGFVKRCMDSKISSDKIAHLIKVGAHLHPSIEIANREFEKRGWIPAALMAIASLLPLAYNIYNDWRSSSQQSPQPTPPQPTSGTPPPGQQNFANPKYPAYQNVPVNLPQTGTQMPASSFGAGINPSAISTRPPFVSGGGSLDFGKFFSKGTANSSNQTQPGLQSTGQGNLQQNRNPYLSITAKGA